MDRAMDLHMHSFYSEDGEYSPGELVARCAKAGIRHMSITDHNCIRANREAIEAAESRQVQYWTGIEIDCVYDALNFHVLGYQVDIAHPAFQEIEENIREQCGRVSRERLHLVHQLGFRLTEAEVAAVAGDGYWREHWTGEVIAEALLTSDRYRDAELLRPYRPEGARSDNPYVNVYWDYFAQGKPCHVEMRYPNMRDVLARIHDSGGKAVLAHPGVQLEVEDRRLDGLIALGLDGLEAYSSYHEQHVARWLADVAEKYGLMVTCGSDFHGKVKPAVQLGRCER